MATSPDVAWCVSVKKCSKYQVVVKVLWLYSTGQVILISWSAVHSQVAKSVLHFAFLLGEFVHAHNSYVLSFCNHGLVN